MPESLSPSRYLLKVQSGRCALTLLCSVPRPGAISKPSVSLFEASSNPGVSMRTTILPSRVNPSARRCRSRQCSPKQNLSPPPLPCSGHRRRKNLVLFCRSLRCARFNPLPAVGEHLEACSFANRRVLSRFRRDERDRHIRARSAVLLDLDRSIGRGDGDVGRKPDNAERKQNTHSQNCRTCYFPSEPRIHRRPWSRCATFAALDRCFSVEDKGYKR